MLLHSNIWTETLHPNDFMWVRKELVDDCFGFFWMWKTKDFDWSPTFMLNMKVQIRTITNEIHLDKNIQHKTVFFLLLFNYFFRLMTLLPDDTFNQQTSPSAIFVEVVYLSFSFCKLIQTACLGRSRVCLCRKWSYPDRSPISERPANQAAAWGTFSFQT